MMRLKYFQIRKKVEQVFEGLQGSRKKKRKDSVSENNEDEPDNLENIQGKQTHKKAVADPEGVQGVCLNPPLSQNYFFVMGNLEKLK